MDQLDLKLSDPLDMSTPHRPHPSPALSTAWIHRLVDDILLLDFGYLAPGLRLREGQAHEFDAHRDARARLFVIARVDQRFRNLALSVVLGDVLLGSEPEWEKWVGDRVLDEDGRVEEGYLVGGFPVSAFLPPAALPVRRVWLSLHGAHHPRFHLPSATWEHLDFLEQPLARISIPRFLPDPPTLLPTTPFTLLLVPYRHPVSDPEDVPSATTPITLPLPPTGFSTSVGRHTTTATPSQSTALYLSTDLLDMTMALGAFVSLLVLYDPAWPSEPIKSMTRNERLRRMFEDGDLVHEGLYPDPRFEPDPVTGHPHQPEGQALFARLKKILADAEAADGKGCGDYWVMMGLVAPVPEFNVWDKDFGWPWASREIPANSNCFPRNIPQLLERVALAELSLRSGLVDSLLLTSPSILSVNMAEDASAGAYAYLDWIGMIHSSLPTNLLPSVGGRLSGPIPRQRVNASPTPTA